MRTIEILKTDWLRLRRAYPSMSDEELQSAIMERGRRHVAEEPQESIDPHLPIQQRLVWLRRWTPRKAASIAALGYELVKNRDRLARASRFEQHVYNRYIELNREVIPGLKVRANQLRDQIRRLEEELRARGRDPEGIDPKVPARIEVDDYKPVEFEDQERRQKTVDFFRRIGGDR